jgi:hypothetical protein
MERPDGIAGMIVRGNRDQSGRFAGSTLCHCDAYAFAADIDAER